MTKLRPLCRWCGKPLPKATTYVYCKPEPTQYDGNDKHVYGVFRTKADCQRVVNGVVISVRRRSIWNQNDDTWSPGDIGSFTVWDGESYDSVLGYFCTNNCAMALGRAAVHDKNLCGTAYTRARKLQQEDDEAANSEAA